ncbi:MAG: hypothetical protein IT531_10240 [Burkholderiales bacterium]|nr:hypothetical protein [Burkholderiales bacterium]
MQLDDERSAQIAGIQRWRRSVVRLWIVTMLAALGVLALLAGVALPAAVEALLGTALAAITGLALCNMRRGACPSCGERIRFQPRIELPPACTNCGASFFAPAEPSDRAP